VRSARDHEHERDHHRRYGERAEDECAPAGAETSLDRRSERVIVGRDRPGSADSPRVTIRETQRGTLPLLAASRAERLGRSASDVDALERRSPWSARTAPRQKLN